MKSFVQIYNLYNCFFLSFKIAVSDSPDLSFVVIGLKKGWDL